MGLCLLNILFEVDNKDLEIDRQTDKKRNHKVIHLNSRIDVFIREAACFGNLRVFVFCYILLENSLVKCELYRPLSIIFLHQEKTQQQRNDFSFCKKKKGRNNVLQILHYTFIALKF